MTLKEDDLIVLAEELLKAGHAAWLIEGDHPEDAEASLEMLNSFILSAGIKGYLITERKMMKDYTKMDGPKLVNTCGSDAYKWADAFCQLNPDVDIDQDVLMGWFANAIMTSLDMSNGTIINGDHARYLIDNDLSPRGSQ